MWTEYGVYVGIESTEEGVVGVVVGEVDCGGCVMYA